PVSGRSEAAILKRIGHRLTQICTDAGGAGSESVSICVNLWPILWPVAERWAVPTLRQPHLPPGLRRLEECGVRNVAVDVGPAAAAEGDRAPVVADQLGLLEQRRDGGVGRVARAVRPQAQGGHDVPAAHLAVVLVAGEGFGR